MVGPTGVFVAPLDPPEPPDPDPPEVLVGYVSLLVWVAPPDPAEAPVERGMLEVVVRKAVALVVGQYVVVNVITVVVPPKIRVEHPVEVIVIVGDVVRLEAVEFA